MRTLPLASLALATLALPLQGSEVTVTRGSLLSLTEPGIVDAAFWFGVANRELTVHNDLVEVDVRRVGASAGITPFTGLNLRGGGGWFEADLTGSNTQSGVEWHIGGTLSAFEFTAGHSPVVGARRIFSIETDLRYGEGTVDGDNTFEWSRLTLAPRIRYTANHAGRDAWHRSRPTGYTVYAGLVWEEFDAEIQDARADNQHDFGFQAGAGLLWRPGWTARLEATLFSGADRRLDLGVGYVF